jgi:hypothetical protein
LTPVAGIVALLVLVPLTALYVVSKHARRVRSSLRLPEPRDGRRSVAAALVAVGVLVGLAAAQPVLAQTEKQRIRTDAEVFVVFDTSRSMLAGVGASSPTRLERAKAEALSLRSALRDVPVGVASMTDRTLPNLFPVTDENVFRATVEQAIGIEKPPPIAFFSTLGTTFASLSAVATRAFFSPRARHRVLILYTDGESRPFDAASLGTVLRRGRGIRTIFVHVWDRDELVYTEGTPEPDYQPDPASVEMISQIVDATGGVGLGERQVDAAADTVRRFLGTGPTGAETSSQVELALGPYFMLVAGCPLLVLLVRRSR